MNKIDFITAIEGTIELHAGDTVVGRSNDAMILAEMFRSVGGPADTIMGSSSCDFAEEYGFASQKDFDDLWDEVCGML